MTAAGMSEGHDPKTKNRVYCDFLCFHKLERFLIALRWRERERKKMARMQNKTINQEDKGGGDKLDLPVRKRHKGEL